MKLWCCLLCPEDDVGFDRFAPLQEHLLRQHAVAPERLAGAVADAQMHLCGRAFSEKRTVWRVDGRETVITIEQNNSGVDDVE